MGRDRGIDPTRVLSLGYWKLKHETGFGKCLGLVEASRPIPVEIVLNLCAYDNRYSRFRNDGATSPSPVSGTTTFSRKLQRRKAKGHSAGRALWVLLGSLWVGSLARPTLIPLQLRWAISGKLKGWNWAGYGLSAYGAAG